MVESDGLTFSRRSRRADIFQNVYVLETLFYLVRSHYIVFQRMPQPHGLCKRHGLSSKTVFVAENLNGKDRDSNALLNNSPRVWAR